MFDILGFIFGFAEISISGENCEKFLNLASKKRIHIWNLKYKNKSVVGRIRPKDFKKLIDIKRQTKTKIKLLKKKGAVFEINKMKGRNGVFIGIILFVLIIKFASLFILGIEIFSNKQIKRSEVLSALSNNGVKTGVFKRSIDTNLAAQNLILSLPNVTWASVNIEGCILNVNLKIEKEKKHSNLPSNIVAKNDGIIEKINAVSGETMKSVGDTVLKGEVLISGIRESGTATIFERSKGQIIARTEHIYTEKGLLSEEKYVDNGIKTKKVLEVFGFKIPLYIGSVKYPHRSIIREKNLKILGKRLPISVTKKVYYLKAKKKITVSKNELIKILDKKTKEKIKKEGFLDYAVVNRKIKKQKNTLTITTKVSALENISKESNIILLQK